MSCLFSQAASAQKVNPADLIECKFCQRGANSRATGEDWESRYAAAQPWQEGERNSFMQLRRMCRENRNAAEFGRTQAFRVLYDLHFRTPQPQADFVPRGELDAATRARDTAIRERDSARQERDAARQALMEREKILRSIRDLVNTVRAVDRSRSPRRPLV